MRALNSPQSDKVNNCSRLARICPGLIEFCSRSFILVDALVRLCLMALFVDSTRCVEDIPSVWAPGCTRDATFLYRLQKKKIAKGYNR